MTSTAAQQVALDNPLVAPENRVQIEKCNIRIDPINTPKEITYQVVLDSLALSFLYPAFLITAEVPKIYMHQFWHTITKIKNSSSYKFKLDKKKCTIDVEVFRDILQICPRLPNKEFDAPPSDEEIVTFIKELGHRGNIKSATKVVVDQMPNHGETFATIQQQVSLPGNFPDFTFRIENRDCKKQEKVYYPRFTKAAIPEVMLNDAIKQSESYLMFIKYSTGLIPPKKSRGKGSQRKKTVDDSQETVDVSKPKPKPKPEPVKRKTASRRLVKKKVTIFADDNIISNDPNIALELGKSISKTKAEEAEAPRQVHATHARIVTEFVPEPTKRRKLGKVTSDPPKKLKGVPSLTLKEQEAADTMQALKESRKTSKRKPGTRGSNEGTGTIPRVPDESTVVSATSSEGTKRESEYSKEDQIGDEEKDDKDDDVDDEGDDYISDKQDADDKDAETESDEDEIYKYKIRVHKDEDVEMSNAKVKDSDKGDEEVADAAKADAEKTLEVKDDAKKTELPPTSSSLYLQTMHANKSFNINLANHRLYHDLMEALIEDENAMDKGVANIGKKTKRRRTKESESSKKPSTTKETPKGKAPSKGSKTGKFASAKELVEEPTTEVVMDYAGDDVAHDDDQPQDASEPKTAKTPNPEGFTQPLRPPTPDPEWNKHQVVHDQPEQPWFNLMVSSIKDPLTFDDLMATPIDFSKYVLNRLKIDNLTQDILLGLAYNLLKGTCHPGHLTVATDYFFNNDLEYIKSSNPERTYTTSIIKTKAARYEIKGIEDMSVSVKKLHVYGHLEEIVVKRADGQLYKFKEADFVDLHLNDIEDISLVIKKCVEDLQLGVESYQKKLNITLPQQTFLEIEFKEPYTPSYKPPGVIYEDLTKLKRVMRADELYKFSDGTLKKVRDKLHHRVRDFDLGYNKEMLRRKWTTIGKKRSELMVELIDKKMREKRIIRNLERLVGARELEMDYKLMTRTT
ncbi:hypothetical protein Tco_1431124 [Tanacetum coccineum]